MRRYDQLWRIAASEAGLAKGYFLSLGIPAPNRMQFKEYSEEEERSDSSQLRLGHAEFLAEWDELNSAMTYKIRSAIQAALNSTGYIYMTIDRSIGLAPGPDWVDIKGRPWIPDIAPVPRSLGRVQDNVRLRIKSVTVVNAPSTVVT